MTHQFKIFVEKHADGFVAYPIGMKGVVVAEGDSCEAAVSDVESAIRFHIESFGEDAFDADTPVLEACIAETKVAIWRTPSARRSI